MLPDPRPNPGRPGDEDQKGDIQTLLANALEAVEHAREVDPSRLAQCLAVYVAFWLAID